MSGWDAWFKESVIQGMFYRVSPVLFCSCCHTLFAVLFCYISFLLHALLEFCHVWAVFKREQLCLRQPAEPQLASFHYRLTSCGGSNTPMPCAYTSPSCPAAPASAAVDAAAAGNSPSSSSNSDSDESIGMGPGSCGSHSSDRSCSRLAYLAKTHGLSGAVRGPVAAAHLQSSSSTPGHAAAAASCGSRTVGSGGFGNRSFRSLFKFRQSASAAKSSSSTVGQQNAERKGPLRGVNASVGSPGFQAGRGSKGGSGREQASKHEAIGSTSSKTAWQANLPSKAGAGVSSSSRYTWADGGGGSQQAVSGLAAAEKGPRIGAAHVTPTGTTATAAGAGAAYPNDNSKSSHTVSGSSTSHPSRRNRSRFNYSGMLGLSAAARGPAAAADLWAEGGGGSQQAVPPLAAAGRPHTLGGMQSMSLEPAAAAAAAAARVSSSNNSSSARLGSSSKTTPSRSRSPPLQLAQMPEGAAAAGAHDAPGAKMRMYSNSGAASAVASAKSTSTAGSQLAGSQGSAHLSNMQGPPSAAVSISCSSAKQLPFSIATSAKPGVPFRWGDAFGPVVGGGGVFAGAGRGVTGGKGLAKQCRKGKGKALLLAAKGVVAVAGELQGMGPRTARVAIEEGGAGVGGGRGGGRNGRGRQGGAPGGGGGDDGDDGDEQDDWRPQWDYSIREYTLSCYTQCISSLSDDSVAATTQHLFCSICMLLVGSVDNVRAERFG